MKPRFTEEAAKHLRDEYKKMRQEEIRNGNKAYRMTVRQLESLIRLSEAIAKVNCDNYIRETYVLEACRLLDKSIIKVEREDVTLSDQLDEN
jgi:DNA replication licensing factor MCM6